MGGSDTMGGVETRKVLLTLSPTTILQLSSMQSIECADLNTGFEYFMTFDMPHVLVFSTLKMVMSCRNMSVITM